MNPPKKPDVQALQGFLRGELDALQSASVEDALRTDPDLLSQLVEERGNDTLLSALRARTRLNYPQGSELKDLLTKLQHLADPNPPSQSEAVVSTPDQTITLTADIEAQVVDDDDLLTMLVPSEGPGEIGRLGGYRVLRMLGKGGMGSVFEAVDDRLERHVALKVMKPRIARRAESRHRFLREARATAKVEHPNVVAIFEVNEDREVPYLAMPMLKGEPLDRPLKSGTLFPLPLALEIGKQIAMGLAAAHKTGLIHRDIKPANIWLEPGDSELMPRVRILDFGLARIAEDDIHLTQSGMIVGTPAYMAPEQARSEPVDHRADLFSLGVTLYEMTTGKRPFKGRDTMSILMSLGSDTPTPPHVLQPTIPHMVSALIVQLLEKDPARRPQTATEVAAQLNRFLVPTVESLSETPRSNSQDPWEGIDDTEKIPDAAPVTETKRPIGSRKRKQWLMGLGAFAAVVLAFVVVVIVRDKNGKKVVEVTLPEGGSIEVVDNAKPKETSSAAPFIPTVPFGEKRAAEHQEAWAKHLGIPVEQKNSIGMKMRVIPPGKFSMVPEHEVALTKPYLIGIHEVTVGQFAAFAKEKKYKTDAEISGEGGLVRIDDKDERKLEYTWKHATISKGDNYPVGQLSWNDADQFCKWLSEKEGKTYRLPTEAEWEWACRAGCKTSYYFGDDATQLGEYAWYADNSGNGTHPVGEKKPNAWGLFDMHGNIAEYVQDWEAELPTKDLTDPKGPKEGDIRVIRGYGFFDPADALTVDDRAGYSPNSSMIHFGFRVVCEVPPKVGAKK